jgi:tmRNA-binding protein
MQTDELWLARKHVWKYTADFNGFQKRLKKKKKKLITKNIIHRWNRRYVNINFNVIANRKLNVDFEDITHPSKTYEKQA